ncbi:hypothetical protein TD95_002499 [Thielaviopsis punctulata]|uniref:UDENN domain-containing protein n=1 Tax=Thielaviopsis punctulata TaxID=72032 RepID=A0A0F4ZFK5_9PEZI|nr:hypothetical protein TD95_002499 [Thielaviopsis punctulata]
MMLEEPIDPWAEPRPETNDVSSGSDGESKNNADSLNATASSQSNNDTHEAPAQSASAASTATPSTPVPVSTPFPAPSGHVPAPIATTIPLAGLDLEDELATARPLHGILSPIEPHIPRAPFEPGFIPLVSVVDFHHARGPEVEHWFGAEEGEDPAVDYNWPLLPFMALSDGAHASSEEFSYFTLLRPESAGRGPATSLFGIACTRQLDASALINRPPDVTRSTVQKAVVVIADSPQHFGMLRERLSIVTQAWFAQREFTDVEILRGFQESLADEKRRGMMSGSSSEESQNLGLSLREFVHEFKWQTLVLLKCCLLQPKMLFFGTRCDRLCMVQWCLISLIPRLIRSLQDCADPELNTYEKTLVKASSFRSTDRASMMAFMGLPLQIFGKGALFGPYTPLQQLDVLADVGTKSYIVGSTNSLLLQQRDRYSDILINLDDNSINITSPSLRSALNLTPADRRWMDFLIQSVNDTWDDANPATPTTLQYTGSEAFIRMHFEEYIIAMLSSVRYHLFIQKYPSQRQPHIDGDPASDFSLDWVEAWSRTENFRMWYSHTVDDMFDIIKPRHPCAGGLTLDDVQRRISEQVKELHLDDKLAQGREVLGRNWAVGKDRASAVVNKLWTDMETYREAQKKKADEEKDKEKESAPASGSNSNRQSMDGRMSVGERASSYMSSWTSWAGEKRKNNNSSSGGGWGFGRKPSSNNTPRSSSPAATPTASSPRTSMTYRSLHASSLSGSSFELPSDVASEDEDERSRRAVAVASEVDSTAQWRKGDV